VNFICIVCGRWMKSDYEALMKWRLRRKNWSTCRAHAWVSLHCVSNLVFLKSWWFVFRDHPVSKFSVHFHIRVDGNCVIWILWLVACCVNNFPGIEQTLYKMHVSILLICKYWGISSNTATKHYTTTPPRIRVGLKIERFQGCRIATAGLTRSVSHVAPSRLQIA
jgi:hypothetical protein